MIQTRVLIAVDSEYRIYGQALARAIHNKHLCTAVSEVVDRESLEAEVERLDPHLTICSAPIPQNPVACRPAWVELSINPDKPSRIKVGERYYESINPSLEELLSVLEETEKLFGKDGQ